ncbi:hypothetical protein CSOJ01_13735 [Colletotrichum sojae]|uniref:Uncharacterized protein n=1 Tax=Colletotrichum sojae TaxID=2175907 RepID=A0A8H6IRK0_9PEZI|nr:hypothetical protein CSOJ01_13735 [Colletotrichum sojae]
MKISVPTRKDGAFSRGGDGAGVTEVESRKEKRTRRDDGVQSRQRVAAEAAAATATVKSSQAASRMAVGQCLRVSGVDGCPVVRPVANRPDDLSKLPQDASCCSFESGTAAEGWKAIIVLSAHDSPF